MNSPTILTTNPTSDYELLDSGDGEKLERYGNVVLSRPDPQALWKKSSPKEWKKPDGIFTGEKKAQWKLQEHVEERWPVTIGDLRFWIHPSAFKHTGVFPEQASNWKWMIDLIRGAKRDISVLNLFAYTGGATLACAKAGASVVHVDGSKVAIKWAKDNAELNNLQNKPIRWIADDAMAFVKREIRRGHTYDAIILDPPAFGHGADGEVWKIESDFSELMSQLKMLLSKKPLFVLLNGYAAGYSSIAYARNLSVMMSEKSGTLEFGELTIANKAAHLLPAGIFARWTEK